MKTTKEQRDEMRAQCAAEPHGDWNPSAIVDLLDDFDELERRERQHYNVAIDAIVQLATTRSARDCGVEPHDPCSLPPGNICDAHTIAELHRELAVAQEKRPDTDGPFVNKLRGIATLWPSANLQGFNVAEWAERNRREIAEALSKAMPVEFARAAVGLSCDEPDILASLPEYQLSPVEREAPARVLAVLTRR